MKYNSYCNLILEFSPRLKLCTDLTHFFNDKGEELFYYNAVTNTIKQFNPPRKWNEEIKEEFHFHNHKGVYINEEINM